MKHINNIILNSRRDKLMKTIKLKFRIGSALLFLFGALSIVSCDLEPQERFEFDPEVSPQVTFGSTTAWEWLQTNPKDEFGFMIEAIRLTGLEDIYNSKTENYTYFLMKDGNWTNNGPGFFSKEFNLKNTAGKDPVDVFADPKVDLNIVKEALLHLILRDYVDQGPGHLKSLDVNYTFNTLSNDVNNKTMTISRDWNYNMQLNAADDLPPGNLGKINSSVGFHNYIFSNGNTVAHILNTGNNPKMTRRYKFGEPLFKL
ncbi:hypothetical protein AXE80_05930 [Wenyingzhuangia fucanilytica]|uniref:FAS1 domain-containing protein n=1 Tax=Wenyingzhuangia fucanilytica TaxID=1790137 RepID=A0A1B1Y530_9FLAO|nr:hypothetical protein [Wenyingzhuangia fucanilytica]ANW95847.1 hypothetical protein AXE80_05930 [Wenyingzhuangia fucanilytica]